VFIGLVAFRAKRLAALPQIETTAVLTSLYRQNHANGGKRVLAAGKSRPAAC
jgi:hypothetical protein